MLSFFNFNKNKIICKVCGNKIKQTSNDAKFYYCDKCKNRISPNGERLANAEEQLIMVCPKCGRICGSDLNDIQNPHASCPSCKYPETCKTKYNLKFYEGFTNKHPSELREWRKSIREQYTIHSNVFNAELYNKEIEKEKEYSQSDEEYEKHQKEIEKYQSEKNMVHCPKCNSISIATISKGYSAITGFVNSGSPMNVCQNCGYKWKPGKE